MNRRTFLSRSLQTTVGMSVFTVATAGAARADAQNAAPVTAEAIRRYLNGMGARWVNPEHTVDNFKSGNPQTPVKNVATAWMGYTSTMRKAHELGCEMIVVHEPIYYIHRDNPAPDLPAVREKRKFLEESGLIVLRCHDVWDRVPKIGIRDAWAEFLGLVHEVGRTIPTDPTAPAPYLGVYEIAPTTSGEFARRVAGRVAALGQSAVGLVGPDDKPIRRVAIGTGACTSFQEMAFELKADLALCSDDGFTFWRDGALAVDMGLPVVVASHGCTEEIGMKLLGEHLVEKFPSISVHHIAQKCMFKTFTAAGDLADSGAGG